MLHRTHARQPTNINNDLRIWGFEFLNNEEMGKKHEFWCDNDGFVNKVSFFYCFKSFPFFRRFPVLYWDFLEFLSLRIEILRSHINMSLVGRFENS